MAIIRRDGIGPGISLAPRLGIPNPFYAIVYAVLGVKYKVDKLPQVRDARLAAPAFLPF